MKSGSNFNIDFEGICILGKYTRGGRFGIIEGDSISLPEQSAVSVDNIVGGGAPSINDNGNRSRSLDLTTVEYFDTPEEAQAAFVAQEQAWAAIRRTGTLTLVGIGSWHAGVPSRTPAIVRGTILQNTYRFDCGKRLS